MTKVQNYVKDDDLSVFRVTYDPSECSTIFTAKVEEVTGWSTEDKEPEQFEPYLDVMIKWDSCSHFNFGDGNGYLHLCGVDDFKRHIFLMEWLYRKAFEVMESDPEQDEVW